MSGRHTRPRPQQLSIKGMMRPMTPRFGSQALRFLADHGAAKVLFLYLRPGEVAHVSRLPGEDINMPALGNDITTLKSRRPPDVPAYRASLRAHDNGND